MTQHTPRPNPVKLALFLALCAIAFCIRPISRQVFGQGIQQSNALCSSANCADIGQPDNDSGNCPPSQPICIFSKSDNNVIYCAQTMGQTCGIVSPLTPQPCNGYCQAKAGINCTVTYNKCVQP